MRTRSRVVARVCRRDDLEMSTRPTDVIKAPLSGDLPAHRPRTPMTRSGAHRIAPHTLAAGGFSRVNRTVAAAADALARCSRVLNAADRNVL